MSTDTSPTRPARSLRRPRAEREQIVLDTAERLFYAHGVHAVGMDALITQTGLGKATVYRLYPTKDALVGAWLRRRSDAIMALIERDVAAGPSPEAALHAIVDAVVQDASRPEFRGCGFNNASVEYGDPEHPARQASRDHRRRLRSTLTELVAAVGRDDETTAGTVADQLAVLIDGIYTSAAHLGMAGPARAGAQLAHDLVDGLREQRR